MIFLAPLNHEVIDSVPANTQSNNLIIDDRTSGNLNSNLGTKWRLVTDNVMGGLSSGKLTLDSFKDKNCIRMSGDVSIKNNGGFVQIALPLIDKKSENNVLIDSIKEQQVIIKRNRKELDLLQVSAVEREKQAQRLAVSEAYCSFDLEQGPLLCNKLLRLDDDQYVLLLTIHHIVSDGWSMGIFSKELEVLYASFSNDQPSPLPDLSIQYTDFSIWQHQFLSEETLTELLGYWKKQLHQAPRVELPTDRPHPSRHSNKGAQHSLTLSAAFTDQLKQLASAQGNTLFTVLVAVNLQTSFLTPPFGFALFYMKGIAPPEVNISSIYIGIIPFVLLQLVALIAVIVFPDLALWLPNAVYD